MARPKHEYPTPSELEILQVLWDSGEGTVRDVHEAMKAHCEKSKNFLHTIRRAFHATLSKFLERLN